MPPPEMISGRLAARILATARSRAAFSTAGRRTCHTRLRKNSSGQSKASACTSWGMAMVTAPVSAGSVSTRMALSRDGISCSGRLMRSKKRETGRKQSLTVTSRVVGSSSCCSTGSGIRLANWSEGNSSTGTRLVVARAAPTTMFSEPGPMEAVHM